MFQLVVNLTRLDQLNEARPTEKTIMMERSILSGFRIFTKTASIAQRGDKWARELHATLHE
jgi:hypothetical protein